MERAADASRQLGDSQNFGRLLEEIRCQLHVRLTKDAIIFRVRDSSTPLGMTNKKASPKRTGQLGNGENFGGVREEIGFYAHCLGSTRALAETPCGDQRESRCVLKSSRWRGRHRQHAGTRALPRNSSRIISRIARSARRWAVLVRAFGRRLRWQRGLAACV